METNCNIIEVVSHLIYYFLQLGYGAIKFVQHMTTFFLWETNESLFSKHQKGIQQEKTLTSEGGMRSMH